ncbi:MAG: ADP-ribosylglycohydrolase family protein [Clostridia bacterium]|nr:ADP-ribosylglycohydrolase family protein [Clostridia bacterium]
MLGAIIGDIVGSPYEFGSHKRKEFLFYQSGCRPTDDSVMTIAVGCACASANCHNEQEFKRTLIDIMREIGRQYPYAGYGGMFYSWLMSDDGKPYGSYGNGSAMRVSPVAWTVDTLEEVETLAKWSAEVTHDHPEGIKGAQAIASAIFLARTGADKDEIRAYIEANYYDLDFSLEEIRPNYGFDVTCQGSVPQAIVCFLESTDFEDTIRNAVSLGGDCDTQAAMAGAIAEAYYGIPDDLQEQAFDYMDETLTDYYWEYAEYLYR